MNCWRIDPPHRALIGAVLLVLTLDFVQGGLAPPLVRPYAYSDFVTFYAAATAFERGLNPYDVEALQQTGHESFPGWVGRYLYPPPFAACVVRPLAWLPFSAARRAWVLVETAAYVAALLLLHRLVFAAAPWGWVAVAALGLPFAPFRFDLHLGSVSGVLLLLVVSFMLAMKSVHPTRAGATLAMAILLKLAPALIVPVLLLAGGFHVVWRTLLAIGLLVLAALPWTGVEAYVHYARDVVPHLLQGSFTWFTNQSLDAFFARLFADNSDTTPWLANPGLYHALARTTSAVVLVMLAAVAWRARSRPQAHPAVHLWLTASALVAALLVARVTWEYMVVLALPCFALWVREIAGGSVGVWRATAAAIAFACCALPIPYAEHPIRSGVGLLLMAPRTYGLALLLALTLAHLWRLTAPHSEPDRTRVSAAA